MNEPLYSRRPDVLWRSTDDRVLLRPVGRGGLITITGSGTFLWELLATPTSLPDLVTRMAMRYQVESDAVEEPVATALTDLENAGVVEIRNGRSTDCASTSNGRSDAAAMPRQRPAAEGSR
jgi:hypothetical protein